MKKLIFLIVIPLVLLGVIFWWFTSRGDGDVAYRAAAITRGDLVVSISATGTLAAVTTVQVGSQVSGTISKLYADFNAQVTEGQLLAQLDPTFLQASVNEQRANVDRAEAQFNEARRNYNRTTELAGRALVSQADLDAATTTLEAAKASLQQARAALDRAQVNLRYATIKAPINGVVISRNVDVGQTVAASLQAPTLFTIAEDLSRMQVEASIDEADIGNVKDGQRVTFRVDSYPEREFEGRVSQIRLAPVVTQNVVTYSVIIDVANPEMKLMPGMTATVSIEVARRDDVLRLPLQALRFSPPDQKSEAPVQRQRVTGSDSVQTPRGGDGVQAAQSDSTRRTRGEGRRRPGREERGGQESKRESGRQQPSGRGAPARVWVLENGQPRSVSIMRGIQNQQFVELIEAPLNEGDSVLVGTTGGPGPSTGSSQTQNPFMPRMPGGRGR